MVSIQSQLPPPPLPQQIIQQYNAGGYIPIRNDATIQTIAERNLIITSSSSSSSSTMMRMDGRKHTERRPISIQLLRQYHSPNNTDTNANTTTTTTTTNSTTTTAAATTAVATVATVTFGSGTRVTCSVTSELVTPNIDRPNDGIISFTVDLSPSASSRYRYATPATSTSITTINNLPLNSDRYQKNVSNHILRTLERCFVQPGGAIDTEALCIVPNTHVWKLHCHCTILDDSGNLIDATILACIAALRHYRQPVVELITTTMTVLPIIDVPTSKPPITTTASNDSTTTTTTTTTTSTTTITKPIIIPSHIKEPTPLPLLHTPIAISFILICNPSFSSSTTTTSSTPQQNHHHHPQQQQHKRMAILIDPTQREELCSSGRITMGMNVYKEICFLDVTTGTNCDIQLSDVRYCYNVATTTTTTESNSSSSLNDVSPLSTMSQILESALSEADELDRNQRLLQLQQHQQQQGLLPLPPIVAQRDINDDGTETIDINRETEMEEEDMIYRRQALDYTIGHVASKIRENPIDHRMNNSATMSKQSRMGTTTTSSNHHHTTKQQASTSNTLLESMLRSVKQQQQELGRTRNDTTSTDIPSTSSSLLLNQVDDGNRDKVQTTTTNGDDDDEEEDIMELQSEFVSAVVVPINHQKSKKSKRKR